MVGGSLVSREKETCGSSVACHEAVWHGLGLHFILRLHRWWCLRGMRRFVHRYVLRKEHGRVVVNVMLALWCVVR